MTGRLRGALAALLVGTCAASAAYATDLPVTVVQLNGPLGARFAGLFVADYQGYYDESEIAVSIIPGGPGVEPATALASGRVSIAVERAPEALAARERGVPLVNIAQLFAAPAMQIVCRADSGIRAPADLRGRKLGAWRAGGRWALTAWLAGQGLAPGDVALVDQDHDALLLLERRADCISAMSYDESAQLAGAGIPAAELTVLPLASHGPAPLEDGYWVLDSVLLDPHRVWGLAAFLYATQRGWEWARANPVEAVRIVQEYDPLKTIEEKPEVQRMHEVNRLTSGAGRLDPAAFDRTVELLLAAGPDRAITRPPVGVWSHAAVDEAGLGDAAP